MVILIDNGHGAETPGKRSPDGRLLEWRYNRELARRLCAALRAEGRDARLLVTEEWDVSLRERVRRANEVARRESAVLVSLHVNAAGNGDWRSARGWCAFVSANASAASRRLASLLASEAERAGLTVRRPWPGVDYWVQSLAMCRDTVCPAVLTENLFMDNRADLDYLLTEEGKATLVRVHQSAITQYLNNQTNKQ